MTKRKDSKITTDKNAKVASSRGKPAHGKRGAKSSAIGASAAVAALFEETRRRIEEIERQTKELKEKQCQPN